MSAFIKPILGGLATGAAGALLSPGQSKQKTPKFQRQIIDQLLQGLQGQGPFANLFQADEGAFKTSVSDPLQQIFRDQTAPGIQQSFIAEGQQRGTPLESSITRAGTDVQSQINQLFLPFQQQAQQNQLSAIQNLLEFSPTTGTTGFSPLQGAAAGILSGDFIKDLTSAAGKVFGGGKGPAQAANPATQNQAQLTQTPRQRLPGFLET